MKLYKRVGIIFLIFFAVFCLSIAITYISVSMYQSRQPLVLPQDEQAPTIDTNQENSQKNKKIVYGFLPYWNIRTVNISPELTTVSYFSFTLNKDGTIQTKLDGGAEPGYRTYQSEQFKNIVESTQAQHQQLELTITMMDADEISSLLSNEQAKQTAINSIALLVQSQPISGINIDIEYAGTVTDSLRDSYTDFIRRIHNKIKAIDKQTKLSIDVFADSGEKYRIWDIAKVSEHVDYIVIMAYDFHRSSSPNSGPVAPLFGSEKNRWDTDIMRCIKSFLQQTPSEKILLGIPFYGYEWTTVSDQPGSQTYPKSGGIATYKRIVQLLSEGKGKEQWDYDALSPYLVYNEDGKTQTIYYENTQSLSYKLELVDQANLGGIAIWALGYEGNTDDLWRVIDNKLK